MSISSWTYCRFGRSDDDAAHSDKEKQDEGPNFKTSGKLAAETNTYKVSASVYQVSYYAVLYRE